MTNLQEAMRLDNPIALAKEIEERRELISNMVGTLYPRIVVGEIVELKERLQEVNKMACSKCGGYYQCNCDLLEIDEKIRVKELEISALMNKRGRLARDRNIQEDTIPAKSLYVKLLHLTKVWSRRALNLEEKAEKTEKATALKVEAKTLRGCREELYGSIEDIRDV